MSFTGLYSLFRSKYIIVTHNTFCGFKSNNQILINLWHGMPLKTMGFLDKMLSEKNRRDTIRGTESIDFLIATSAITRNAMVACFGIEPTKIHVIGQPRNDKLFSVKNNDNLSKLLNRDISNFKKIIIFTPTYRIWDKRVEGVPLDKNIFNYKDFEEEQFQKFLSKNSTLFLIKLHPQEEEHYINKFNNKIKGKNIQFITTKMLNKKLMDLYDILGAVDILITDYSSVYFDFLLLDKPIIFTPTDLEEYSKSRGFVLEPYHFWSPGPKANNFKDLINELNNYINNPEYYAVERETVNNIINRYKDNKSSNRIWELIKEMEN